MDIYESITEIANHPTLKEILEPNIFYRQTVQKWMTKRILYAYALFMKEKNELERKRVTK